MFIHCLKGRTPFLVGYSSGLRGRFALLFTSCCLLARSLILKVSGRERLPLRGDETVMDAGCGTSRLTAELLSRLPHGQVIAVDRSATMLREAQAYLRPRFGERVQFLQTDLLRQQVSEAVDAVLSTATFHWIADHPRLFRNLYR